jgi:hypothetical protein
VLCFELFTSKGLKILLSISKPPMGKNLARDAVPGAPGLRPFEV